MRLSSLDRSAYISTLISVCSLLTLGFPAQGAAQDAAPEAPDAQETPPDITEDAVAQDAPADEDIEDLDELESMMDEVEEQEDQAPAKDADDDGSGPSGVQDDGSFERTDTVEVPYTFEDIANTGGSAQKLTEEDLEQVEADNVHKQMLQVPGVYIRPEDGFGLRPNIGIRGANSDRSKKVTLMLDGVLFGPAPYSAPAAYYFPMVTRVTSIDVFKGPSTIAYGPQTVGGALNFHTREVPNGWAGGLDVAGGSFPTGKFHLWQGWGNDRFGVLVEGVHLQSAGFKELDGGGDTGFRRSEAMLKAHVNSDPTKRAFHKLEVRGTASFENSNETYLGLTDEDFRDTPNRRYVASSLDEMDWRRYSLRADYLFELGDVFDITTTAYRHDYYREWEKFNGLGPGSPRPETVLSNPDEGQNALLYSVLTGQEDSSGTRDQIIIGTNARDYISQGIQSVARHRISTNTWSNRAEAGLRLHNDWIVRNHTEEAYNMVNGALERTDDPEYETTQNRDEAMALAAHALDQFSIWRLTITGGARFEFINTSRELLGEGQEDEPIMENTQAVFLPGIGAQLDIIDGFGVLAGVHRGFSPVAPGQPDEVEPEQSIAYETGVRWIDQERGSVVELIGFYNDYSNLLGQCTFSAGCEEENLDNQFNSGAVDVYGVESVIRHDFTLDAARSIPVRGSYTYTLSEFQSEFDSDNPQFADVQPGDRLPYIPIHQATARVGYSGPRIRANVGASYVGEMREEASQGDQPQQAGDTVRFTDAYWLVDALVAVRVWRNFEIYGKGDNLLDARPIAARRPFGARPIRPLYLQGGIRANW